MRIEHLHLSTWTSGGWGEMVHASGQEQLCHAHTTELSILWYYLSEGYFRAVLQQHAHKKKVVAHFNLEIWNQEKVHRAISVLLERGKTGKSFAGKALEEVGGSPSSHQSSDLPKTNSLTLN